MSQLFTPRTPIQPTDRTQPAPKPATKVTINESLWRRMKPRVVNAYRWLTRRIARGVILLRRYIRGLTRTQRMQHVAILLGAILLLFVLNQIFSRHPAATQTTTTGSNAPLPKENPPFATILPKGKSATSLGGWTRVSPSDRNAVYAYVDRIDTTSIIVSQQPIPESFASDPSGSIQKLAEGYSADHTLVVGDITVYLGKSAKGPQSLIFTTRGLLVLIKSSATIAEDRWVSYIKSLQ